MILYSFIVAVYNVEQYLEECLDSFLNQKYENWEAILVDDGSTDFSGTICDRYASRDSRFKVYHRENQGSLMARRFGISQAKGDYFLFIDSDDLIHNELLEEMNIIIANTKSDMVIYRFRRFGRFIESDSQIVFEEGTIVGEGGLSKEVIWQKVVSGNELNNLCLKVVHKDIIDWTTDYTQYAFMKSGTDFMQSMALLDNAKKIYFSEKILYFYRFNDNGISSMKAKTVDSESIKVHMMTREILQNQKLFYLKKNGYASKENLEQYYRYAFITKVDQIVSWLSNADTKSSKKQIFEDAIHEKMLKEGKCYLCKEMFPKKYKKLYQLYLEDNKKFYKELSKQAAYVKAVSWVSCMLGKIRK